MGYFWTKVTSRGSEASRSTRRKTFRETRPGLIRLKSGGGKVVGQDDFLAGKLLLHQGGLRHPVCQDGGVDGQRGDGHPEGVRFKGLHFRRVQEGEG